MNMTSGWSINVGGEAGFHILARAAFFQKMMLSKRKKQGGHKTLFSWSRGVLLCNEQANIFENVSNVLIIYSFIDQS